jgi:zinc and cadmium transporter
MLNILIATVAISLLSLVGLFFFSWKHELINRLVLSLVAFAAGTMLGSAFLHLLPEALEQSTAQTVFLSLLAGFVLFFAIERLLHWRHCHTEDGKCPVHAFAYLNLIGDALHNFMDGLLIAASFVASPALGWSTAVAIATHELPQEIGDFAVLLHSGMSRGRALFLNFVTALTAVLGAVLGYFLISSYSLLSIILPITAGGFIYIATVDLVPELHKASGASAKKAFGHFGLFLLGIVLMFLFKKLGH